MVRKSLVLFLVLSFVAVTTIGMSAKVCLADGDDQVFGGDPGQIDPGCEPVTPTPFILNLFWGVVDGIAGSIAAIL